MSFIKMQEINLILKTALPLMAAFLAQKGMQVIDTLMMGWISSDALAAGALGTTIFTTVLVFCTGTLSAVGVCIARARGAQRHEEISMNLHHGVILALLLSIPAMAIIWYAPHYLVFFGISLPIIATMTLLLHGLVWGLPGFLLFLVYREFISAFQLTRIVMLLCILSLPLTFVMNDILIYGKYSLPALGIAGIGYAGAIIMWLMFMGLYFFAKWHHSLKSHTKNKKIIIQRKKIVAMFLLGVPSGLLYVLDMGLFLCAAIMMAHHGVDALAAHQIVLQFATIAFSIPVGLSMATALQVSHSMGANNVTQAKRFAWTGVSIGLFISAIIATLLLVTPDTFIHFYLSTNKKNYSVIHQDAVLFLSIAALFQCLDAMQAILTAALKGMQDTFIPMVLCIGCYWGIGIGSAYYLSTYTNFSASGIWYGLMLGICSAAIILLLRFLLRSNTLSKLALVQIYE